MTDEKKEKIDNSIRIDRSHDNTYNVTNNYTENHNNTINNYYNGASKRPPSKKTLIGILVVCVIVIIAVICVVGIVNNTSHYVTSQFAVTPKVVTTPSYTAQPTATPTAVPTIIYTAQPTVTPTAVPTAIYTAQPTVTPTAVPTVTNTVQPTAALTTVPTVKSTPTPTPTPKRVTEGTLVINTYPRGANVYIDDIYKGTTPTSGALSISELSEGTHTLKIECENYQTLTQEVTVVADDYTTLTLSLQLVENPVLRTESELADFFAGKMGSKAKLKQHTGYKGGTITASQPLTLDLMDGSIESLIIPSGKELTVLSSPGNGTITQWHISQVSNSSAIEPYASSNLYGYGVLVERGGKFTLKSGSITSNYGSIAYDSGEIGTSQIWGVINYGTFIMDGGDIVENWMSEYYDKNSYNSSESKVGGVYNEGTMIMNGGDISKNVHILSLKYWSDQHESVTPKYSGGVVTSSTGFTMNGGVIRDNRPYNICYTDTGEKITTTVTST